MHGLAYILLAAVMFALGSPNSAEAARGDSIPGESADREALFEWSPLVRDIQEFLLEFGFLSGAPDGRLSQDIRDAIRRYQRRHKLDVDGEASRELLRHMGTIGRPASLKSRLEEARREQTERAHSALAANPETRDLVNGPVAAAGQRNSLAPELCLKTPDAACLIAIALEATDTVERDDYRDWALREVVQAQARSGRLSELRSSIRRITDVRLIVVSLREAVTGLVDAGRVDDATALARTIPDDWNQARAFAAIVVAETSPPRAAAILGDLRRLLSHLEDKVAASEIAARTAVDLAARGDRPHALALLELSRSFAEPPTDRDTGQASLAVTAGAYARIGLTDTALAILKSVGEIGRDHIALAEAAGRLAQNDLAGDALSLAGKLRAPRLHVLALSKIAAAQSQLGDDDGARATLLRATNASLDIVRPFAADTARAEIAEVWAMLPDHTRAVVELEKIKSRSLRAQTLWQLVAGADRDNADSLRERALEATDAIDSAFDRAAVLVQATHQMAARKRFEDARTLFGIALRNARAVKTDWWRARIFSRLAGVFPSI